MRITTIYLILILLLIKNTVSAQDIGNGNQTLGNCSSYTTKNNQLIFNCKNNAKVMLQFCSGQVLKVWISAEGTFKRNNESFAVINEDLGWTGNINVNEETSAYEVFTEQLRIRVQKSPFKLQIFDKYQKLLFNDFNDRGFVKQGNRVATYKTLKPEEQFFGLGEKAGILNRRGKSYKMWNSDQPCYGVNEDPLYKSIPFFMSTNHYGIFFDNTYKTEFKFGSESNEYYSFEAASGEMIYYFMYGNDFKQIIQNYVALTGKPIMPPKWALGFSQCRGNYTEEQQARNIAAEFRKRKIPCDIIYQDIGWVEGLQDFDWKKNNYQNPKDMVKQLGEQGFKMIVSQDPVISQANKKQWEEADANGYFATDIRTGKSYDMPWPWGGNCGVVDFTKPEVADWWGNYQQKPLSDGVRGFWTDMGEPAWSNEEATDRLNMKHFFTPITADRVVMESTLVFTQLLQDVIMKKGETSIETINLFWNQVDGRESTPLYEIYNQLMEQLGLSLMHSQIKNSTRFRKESEENSKTVFRSTVMPPDERLMKACRLDQFINEFLKIIQL